MMFLFKPFTRSCNEVIEILEQVLGGVMDCRDWDDFISIPIKGNLNMESIRLKCEALSHEETIDPSGIIIHSKAAKQALLQILIKLRSDH